jgi:hypothetical protein
MLLHITVLVKMFFHKNNTVEFSVKESKLPRNFIHTVFFYHEFSVKDYFVYILAYAKDQNETKITIRMIVFTSKAIHTLI